MKLRSMRGRLKKALYGAREAVKRWGIEYSNTLLELGFPKGNTIHAYSFIANWVRKCFRMEMTP